MLNFSYKGAPNRFKLSVVKIDLSSNHFLQVSTMLIHIKAFLNMVHVPTIFLEATFQKIQSIWDIRRAITDVWSLVYAGSLYILLFDK